MDKDGNEVGIIQQLQEHCDKAFKCEQKTPRPMIEEYAQITTNDIKVCTPKKTKHRKAPEVLGLKESRLNSLKVLVDSNKCRRTRTMSK